MTKKPKAYELIRSYDVFCDGGNWEIDTAHDILNIETPQLIKSNKLGSRLLDAWYWLFSKKREFLRSNTTFSRIDVPMALFVLKKSKQAPDAVLADRIITWWHEDATYIQLFQPSVGQLIADFLEQEPDNEHAKKISAEILRVSKL